MNRDGEPVGLAWHTVKEKEKRENKKHEQRI